MLMVLKIRHCQLLSGRIIKSALHHSLEKYEWTALSGLSIWLPASYPVCNYHPPLPYRFLILFPLLLAHLLFGYEIVDMPRYLQWTRTFYEIALQDCDPIKFRA
jgi:hypothetical protein